MAERSCGMWGEVSAEFRERDSKGAAQVRTSSKIWHALSIKINALSMEQCYLEPSKYDFCHY